jgi:apolipoprotein N-acyltransferase
MLKITDINVAALHGWRRNALAFVCGICATLALPPFFLFPLLIPAFSGLFLLIHNARGSHRAFWDGWFWGWGFYMTGLYWFCIALLTDPEKFAWMIPFALFALTGVIAVYCAVACWLTVKLPAKGLSRVFIFSAVWLAVEFARGHVLSGFPWNLPGYSFAFSDASLQLASLFGAYGLSWLAVWLGALPAALMMDGGVHRKPAIKLLLASYMMVAAGIGWGAWRLSDADRIPEKDRYVEGVMLRIVQANISQHHKWDPKLQMHGLKEFVRLTHAPGIERVTHIVWPETAVPYVLKPNSPLTRFLREAIPPGKFLITGALRMEGEGSDSRIFNSIDMLASDGKIVGAYDKHKLVPFGEFVPLRWLLPKTWLTPVGDRDFSAGPGPQTLSWPGLPPVSPLICYEAIFPDLAVLREHPPQWLLNVTNDAWFGMSSGPYQHFIMARMRAVEQGLPLVRAANTGISAVIDANGKTVSKLDLETKNFLDSKLPKSLENKTFYNQYADLFGYIIFCLALSLIIYQQRRRIN